MRREVVFTRKIANNRAKIKHSITATALIMPTLPDEDEEEEQQQNQNPAITTTTPTIVIVIAITTIITITEEQGIQYSS